MKGLFTKVGHFEVLLHLELIICPQYVIEVLSIRKANIFLFWQTDLLLEVEGVDGLIDEAVDTFLLKRQSLDEDLPHLSCEAQLAYHLTVGAYLLVPVQLQRNYCLQELTQESPVGLYINGQFLLGSGGVG